MSTASGSLEFQKSNVPTPQSTVPIPKSNVLILQCNVSGANLDGVLHFWKELVQFLIEKVASELKKSAFC
jgi:hypothetical protein